ncbi:hypothetical protein Suden_0040 [Sulfurimonas denitrificans DSM 1251]|uniref:Uncharacterized protein n=1 Tax=Sulfurimonas denitrificans (strain ATCC 33889 / DSM 1251) TaxID=326298 RepID=Q30UL0_SULDN|nr:helix-turn-helix domain-containing protein [Sulfurimonas denitrificans]ABB43321.1 hypothetical protein Suden_0040 [Sulfurimonas denitrificans DSM 1251]MDD3443358.1 helix-turn-helix domain-containing protein [Sulfurimonas denitrificans]
MSKLTISDAAEFLGVSKEAIHNRIRRGTLECIVENDVKLVLINQEDNTNNMPKKPLNQKSVAKSDEKYYRFLEEQNTKLQHRVDTLEGETRSLRDQKEQMLIDERIKIENIYKEKDEQLKNIINAISSKLLLSTPQKIQDTIEGEIDEAQDIEDEHDEDVEIGKSRLTSLNKYLKSQDFSKKKISKIKEKFKERAKDDSRVVIIGKKYYIDFKKYDYSDFSI